VPRLSQHPSLIPRTPYLITEARIGYCFELEGIGESVAAAAGTKEPRAEY